jgi:septal ring factor EnvC (AmiA/AmiB activator)
MKKGLLSIALTALAALVFGGMAPAHAAPKVTERSKQKQAAEAERAELRKKLDNLKHDISRTESAKEQVADTLAASEQAISGANRSLHELNREQSETESRLGNLAKQQSQLESTIAHQQKKLSRLLHEQYISGNEDRMKLLLSGDNPNRINREMQYMSYVSQAQAKLIASMRTNLQTVELNRAQTENAKLELDEIVQEKREQRQMLEKEKAKRATLLAQLSSKLNQQRKEAGRLERDQNRLSNLVDRLGRMIEEQKRAAARKPRPAKQPKQAKRSDGARQQVPEQVDEVPEAVADGAFARMRGRMRLPVRGSITARFGAKRADGPSWKGLFISAPEGAEVRAVADGKVVFADWLRGFGNMVIVDHGSQYMTIYGNTHSMLKHAGDSVRAGDVIAGAGNSGGNEQTGLYFEMRHRGRAVNPLDWVTIR